LAAQLTGARVHEWSVCMQYACVHAQVQCHAQRPLPRTWRAA